MRKAEKTYKALRDVTSHIPYNDIEIDIDALKSVNGGDFIIGIRKMGTTTFLYRKPQNWHSEFSAVMETWPNTEWYSGSVNEGWITAVSDSDVPKMLKHWEYAHFAK